MKPFLFLALLAAVLLFGARDRITLPNPTAYADYNGDGLADRQQEKPRANPLRGVVAFAVDRPFMALAAVFVTALVAGRVWR